MSRFALTEPLDGDRHRIAGFSCGRPSLDRWLLAYAGQSQRRDAARTFVTAAPDGRVRGYYTLVAAQLEHPRATPAVRRGMSRHFPIPIALIARLAVDGRDQGHGLGPGLLLEALTRVLAAGEELAIRATVAEAIDDRAAGFYALFGFQAASTEPHLLMVEMDTARQILGFGGQGGQGG